ncbi:SDR family NAD(P)-dependent oxidoreductase [Chryseosolibacter indicus]|uniref:SDR family NAD(P)-dependent oxidoreductase n=1 Tax=Chryseosolibacter indicus TaxID=2782351 RepID=A0ABS5VPZ4_9BACT|nr:SDR family NAD(P)-dependent oxidoreductase [Chryseosolibacter indicus]MBT1703525.1 SDR family NAD(P)-dependent oxidoreductase [Chryseosolibacter indicus]
MQNPTKSSSISKSLAWAAAGFGLYLAANTVYREINKYNLNGKVVLITGGSRGLGLVLARELTLMGARIAICARSSDQLNQAKFDLERLTANSILSITADVTDQMQVSSMINEVIKYYGRIDVIINNAGIVQVGPVESMSIEDYEQAMKTNFWAALYTIKAVLPHFMERKSGRIVNISSIGGKVAMPHLLPYSASKFALTGLSEGLHAELKKYNIHVTTVIPNLMRTGSPRNISVKGDHEAEYAWFKISDSSPLLSQQVEVAAKSIIKALQYGDSEAILTTSAKIATAVKGIAPSLVNSVLAITNLFLPDNKEGGRHTKLGFEAESKLSTGPVTALSDQAASLHNEIH